MSTNNHLGYINVANPESKRVTELHCTRCGFHLRVIEGGDTKVIDPGDKITLHEFPEPFNDLSINLGAPV